jgi:hypothetical protein
MKIAKIHLKTKRKVSKTIIPLKYNIEKRGFK